MYHIHSCISVGKNSKAKSLCKIMCVARKIFWGNFWSYKAPWSFVSILSILQIFVSILENLGWQVCKKTTLHTYYNAGTQYNELVYTIHTFNVHCTCMNWMHEIRAKKRVKFANIKMSHPKSQNEPRWLMSHRLGTPGLGSKNTHFMTFCQYHEWPPLFKTKEILADIFFTTW